MILEEEMYGPSILEISRLEADFLAITSHPVTFLPAIVHKMLVWGMMISDGCILSSSNWTQIAKI